MTKSKDFGFNSSEFLDSLNTIPYCQFLNASSQNYGLAITSTNAQGAEFELTDSWEIVEHEFSDGTRETLFVTKKPKLLVLNRSEPLMSSELEVIPYNKAKFSEGNYQAFSYIVVWFLDKDNQTISTLPFRLKCSGYSGLTFLKNYSYYNNSESFTKKFLHVYKSLTGDTAIEKNNIFYAHAIYQPKLVRTKVTSRFNGQSSFAVITDSFVEPTPANFSDLIIRNGSSISNKIKEYIEMTSAWLRTSAQLIDEPAPTSEPTQELEASLDETKTRDEISF